jgi:type IV pilus assembly protein PilC
MYIRNAKLVRKFQLAKLKFGFFCYLSTKSAEFFESEVDEAVAAISSLMEPFIIVFLGTIIGGLVVALYLPIFKLGQVV